MTALDKTEPAKPSFDRLYIQFATASEGYSTIRKWSQFPFEGAEEYAAVPAPSSHLEGDLERCAQIARAVYEAEIDRRDACLSEGPPNCEGALTRARQAQTAQEIEKKIRSLTPALSPAVVGLIREAADIIQEERDGLFDCHAINGKLRIDDETDRLAEDAIAEMDEWLLRAKAALFPEVTSI